MLAKDVGHVRRRLNDSVHLLYVSVLACDVALGNLLSVHPGLVDVRGLMVGEYRQVLAGDFVEPHVGRQEMNHRCCRTVFEDGDALSTALELCPSSRIRHFCRIEHLNRVVNAQCGFTSHTHAFHWWRTADVRQQFDEIGIVDHRVVKQQLLLRLRQLLVAAHPPVVVVEPLLEG